MDVITTITCHLKHTNSYSNETRIRITILMHLSHVISNTSVSNYHYQVANNDMTFLKFTNI